MIAIAAVRKPSEFKQKRQQTNIIYLNNYLLSLTFSFFIYSCYYVSSSLFHSLFKQTSKLFNSLAFILFNYLRKLECQTVSYLFIKYSINYIFLLCFYVFIYFFGYVIPYCSSASLFVSLFNYYWYI
jgi:hypothetical protein